VNLPLRAGAGADAVAALVTVDNPAVVVEAVKLAEDRSGDLIVRLYESRGARARASVSFDGVASSVETVETDLLERELAQPAALAEVDGATASLQLRPFQLVTLRIRRA
ncbi:MAG TPA: glycosyl hydrolase-related protein, partial [Microbacteriaceae bacterium]|nr:glycosyl hydrolase-related protein [Microbacteriaceae bacterium]